jgi:hypothetical protein
MKIPASIALLGCCLLTPAFASDQVPKFNVEPSCKSAADVGIVDSQSVPACMRDEEAARKTLGPVWQSYSVAERTRCTDEASSGGISSYVELLVCLQMAREVKELDKAEAAKLKGASKRQKQ